MSTTPRTDAFMIRIDDTEIDLSQVEDFCRDMEMDNAALRKELAEVTAAVQKECDHRWQFIDDSFDHAFGTEKVHSWRCTKCGASRDTQTGDYAGPDDDGPDPEVHRDRLLDKT